MLCILTEGAYLNVGISYLKKKLSEQWIFKGLREKDLVLEA